MPELSEAGKRRKARAREPQEKSGSSRDAFGKVPIHLEEAKLLLLPFLGAGQSALLAVSGGPDSVTLMRLCALVAKTERLAAISVATVDHGLRENSRAEAEEVAVWARECGFAYALLSWKGRKPSSRIQEKARAARYALLHARMREIGAWLLVTAHTLDDQAETVLMRVAHGSGIAGLAGMRPLSERDGLIHAKPFLSIPKARLLATCRVNGWAFVEDPSNENPRFARTRWRRLAPALEKEGLTAARLAKLAERAASLEDAIEVKASAAFARALVEEREDGLVLDVERMMRREPRELALRLLLRAVALSAGARRAPIRLERAENLLNGLFGAFAAGKPFKCTLGGALLTFDGAKRLSVRRENTRRRGKRGGRASKPAVPARIRLPSQANQGNSIALSALV